jgi:TonB family C-terminal domain
VRFRAIFGALALVFALCGASAHAQEAEPVFVNPEWIVRPSPQDVAEFYPQAARNRRVDGRVVVQCVINLDTTLDCVVAEETPGDWGFGAAALEISRKWRVRPATRDGLPVEGGRLRVPLRFSVR